MRASYNEVTTGHIKLRELRRDEMRRRTRINHDGQKRLVPGPLPNPDLERCLRPVSSVLTEREFKAFLRHKPHGWTNSKFMRAVLCQFLESHRRKDMPTQSFVEWMGASEALKGAQVSDSGPQGPEQRRSANLVIFGTIFPRREQRAVPFQIWKAPLAIVPAPRTASGALPICTRFYA